MMIRHQIIQNAYYARDIDSAVDRWSQLWGLGPFFVRRRIGLENIRYKGTPSTLEISAAYVQAGDIMVELVTQHDDAPSIFRDRYRRSEEGFHHVALGFGDHDAMVAHYQRLGFPAVTSFLTSEGRGATYVDAFKTLGHAIEIYIVNDSLRELYNEVRRASENWSGRNLVIEL